MARVVVIGGGLAGIAAAVALADAGRDVILVEKRATLGGRAGSFAAKGFGHDLDSSQHVLLGCCVNQLDLYRRLGVEHLIDWHERLPLLAADGRRGEFASWPLLPPPLHLLPGLLAYPGLGWADRVLLAGAFGRMMLADRRRARLDDLSFQQWLGAWTTPRLDRCFWRFMLTSVLNAPPAEVSAQYGLMYFLDGLMRHRDAWKLGVPREPLSALHHHAVLAHLAAAGGEVRLRSTARVRPTSHGPRVSIDGESVEAEAAVIAVRWGQLPRVLPSGAARRVAGGALERLRGAPIIGVHLLFDEPVTQDRVLGLVDHDVEWVLSFDGGRRLSIVGSAAASWQGMSALAMKDRAMAALRGLWPDLPEPRQWAACREAEATFVPAPGLERHRPGASTPWPGLYLAGAWTATGWPATQEGAVRSGYAAASAILGVAVGPPDLPRQGLLRGMPRRPLWCRLPACEQAGSLHHNGPT